MNHSSILQFKSTKLNFILLPQLLCQMCHMQSSGRSYLTQRTQNTLVYSIRVSQGSVVTRFGWGGILNIFFIANFPQSLSVKEFRNVVENWQSYRYELVYNSFGDTM